MALNGLFRADMPLRNYSLTQSVSVLAVQSQENRAISISTSAQTLRSVAICVTNTTRRLEAITQ